MRPDQPTLPIRAIEGRVTAMKAIVVYESLWGNTAAIARAIAEGIGPEARALYPPPRHPARR